MVYIDDQLRRAWSKFHGSQAHTPAEDWTSLEWIEAPLVWPRAASRDVRRRRTLLEPQVQDLTYVEHHTLGRSHSSAGRSTMDKWILRRVYRVPLEFD